MASKRVVLLMKRHLGDAVMMTPLIDGLIDLGHEVALMTTPTVHSMLCMPGRPLELVEWVGGGGLKKLTEQSDRLRDGRFDMALIPNRSFRSALAAKLADIPLRSGHAKELRQFLLTHSTPYNWKLNEAECYLQLGRALGLELPERPVKLECAEEERKLSKELLQGATLGVQPGATDLQKRIPINVLASFCDEVAGLGHKVAVLGGPDELAFGEALEEACGSKTVNLVGKTSIRGTIGLLANLQCVLGGDTGVMHMAVALGTPTVTVFTIKPSAKWGHHYAPHTVLHAPKGDHLRIESSIFREAVLKNLRSSAVSNRA